MSLAWLFLPALTCAGLFLAIPLLLIYAGRLRREADEWTSIAAHHEQMTALRPGAHT